MGNASPALNDDGTGERFRDGLYSIFFTGGYPVWWMTDWTTTAGGSPSNMYIGPLERQASLGFRQAFGDFDPAAAAMSAQGSSNIRAYVMGSPKDVGGYIRNKTQITSPASGETIQFTLPAGSWTGRWIKPADGSAIAAISSSGGTQTFSIPAFTEDIAFRIQILPAATDQPTIYGVFNAASWGLAEVTPVIAQGSIMVIAGSNMGPGPLARAQFPLPASQGLSGVKVTISMNGSATDAIMLWAESDYAAAILPSTVPVGAGSLTITWNGQTSAPQPITVVSSSVGIFATSQAGYGAGVVTDANVHEVLVSPATPARTGDTLILWSTGLGPVTFDETRPPPYAQNMQNDLGAIIHIGNSLIAPHYAGRSGCCAGLDQIQFTVPGNISGCSVPIAVEVGGRIGGVVTTAINLNGSGCMTGPPSSH